MACFGCWDPEVMVVYQVYLNYLGPSTNSTDPTSQSYSCPHPSCLRLWTVCVGHSGDTTKQYRQKHPLKWTHPPNYTYSHVLPP